jgi:tape measure domain-containing protein
MAKKLIQVIYKVEDKELIAAQKAIRSNEQAAKAADNEIKKYGNDAQKAGKQASGSFMDFRNVLDSIVSIGIVSMFGRLTKSVFDLGVKQQQLNIAFEVFLGSATKAKKVIEELTRFSIVTPFTPDQVNKAAQALLAFGTTAEDLIPTLKFLGDVSSGTGKDLAEMAIIFGQIKSTGRLMGQDLLQLINAGFNPLQQISEKTGKSVKTLKEEMEKGLVSFDMVKQAFIDATSEGGKFFNLMDKQSQSIGGKLSTITGNIEEVAKGIFESNIDLVTRFVDKLSSATDILLNWVKTANSDPIFEQATKNVDSYRASLDNAFKEFESGAGPDAINKALQDNVKETNSWSESVNFLVKEVAKAGKEDFPRLNAQLQVEQQTVRLLSELTQEFTKKVQNYVPVVKEVSSEEKKLFEQRQKFLNDFLKTNQTDGTEPIVPWIGAIDGDPLAGLRDYINKAGDLIDAENPDGIAPVVSVITGGKDKDELKDELDMLLDMSLGFLDDIFQATINSQQKIYEAESFDYDRKLALAGDNERAKMELAIEKADFDKEQAIKKEAFDKEQDNRNKQAAIKKMTLDVLLGSIRALITPPVPNFLKAGLVTGFGFAQIGAAKALGFKDGVIDLQGPGTGTSDSIPSMLSKGESVMTADETVRSRNLLTAIREKKIDDRILEKAGTAQLIVASLNDKRIVQAIRENRQPSLAREGYTLMETHQKGSNLRIKQRAKLGL